MAGEYYKTKESVEEYIKAAEGFNGAELIEKLKGFLSSNSSLLELGTGPGSDWIILNQHYEVTGSDNSKEFINYLSSNNPDGRFLELDAATLNTEDRFDGIYSNKVLHHLKDDELRSSIRRQADILKTGGIISHSFWKGEGSETFKGLFVNYHTGKALTEFFESFFYIVLLESYEEFEAGDSLLLIGRKKEFS